MFACRRRPAKARRSLVKQLGMGLGLRVEGLGFRV